MPKFEYIDKFPPHQVPPGTFIILRDDFWKVVQSIPMLGHSTARMFVLSYWTHTEPRGFKFEEFKTDIRIPVYKMEEE